MAATSVEESLTWMKTLLDLGVDLLEVPFPFPDPVADGPTIVNACHKALTEDLKIKDCLLHLKTLAQAYPNSKIVFMSYLNPIFKFGMTTFVEQASLSGISGIIPDLAIENAQEYQQACDVFKIDPIWLVTPSHLRNV
ncbi:tryptophan synthase subunit alpha [Paucibacter sp. O1-1]|nr:tryptophan synthase subunit alpha [Paucibacter sp. O1-1]MDA3824317.1 tryptophan synthase subunit alpha [Paucibacter sp. O1-1]